MAFKKTRATRTTPPKSADDFINAAEKKPVLERTLEERLAQRAIGVNYNALALRMTEQQKKLLSFAARKQGTSMQKLIADVLHPWLEERYGKEFDQQEYEY